MKRVLDLYDFITKEHAENVAGLARVVKNISDLTHTEAKLLELVAWLHDLGKSINYNYLSIDNLIRWKHSGFSVHNPLFLY